MTIDWNRQKESDADSKVIQKKKICWKIKIANGINADGVQSEFILTIFKNDQD